MLLYFFEEQKFVKILGENSKKERAIVEGDFSSAPVELILNLYFNFFFSYFRKMSTALRCPFLSRIPVNQVKKTANHLMSYAERCPVMVHAMSYMNSPDMMTVTGNGSRYFGGALAGTWFVIVTKVKGYRQIFYFWQRLLLLVDKVGFCSISFCL